MSSPQEIENIKCFLKQKYIITSTDWIEACVNFVKQEHNQNLPFQNLKNFVYQQWLTADLEEIGVSSLPPELPTTQKTTVNGCYALQVDGIRDVGKPAYSQLKELQRNVNTNANFAAAPDTTLAPWEAKPTRMLMLNLTDGCIHIQGMEYRTITALSPNLPPGVKVQIQGPVDCRFGVLMLMSDNIKILGGEVETKLVQYSRKAILKEILQLPVEDNTEAIPEENLPATDSILSNSSSTLPISANLQTQSTLSSWSNNTTQQIRVSAASTRQEHLPGTSSGNQRSGHSNSHNVGGRSSNSLPVAVTNASLTVQNENLNNGDSNDLDDFEEDDFDQGLDYTVLDEIENNTLQSSNQRVENIDEMHDIEEAQDVWLEDEDVVQDLLEFQDEDPGFQMPFEEPVDEPQSESLIGNCQKEIFSLLSSVINKPEANCTITVKGFIVRVLSKLECTVDKGWSLMVQISDGSASLDVCIHDQVIEGIIGISAPAMVKKQQTADTPEKRNEVVQAISKFKATLQDYNCLMDVKLTPGSKPYLMKCYPLDQLHVQQLRERAKSHS